MKMVTRLSSDKIVKDRQTKRYQMIQTTPICDETNDKINLRRTALVFGLDG